MELLDTGCAGYKRSRDQKIVARSGVADLKRDVADRVASQSYSFATPVTL
jgi:hypothetical protein